MGHYQRSLQSELKKLKKKCILLLLFISYVLSVDGNYAIFWPVAIPEEDYIPANNEEISVSIQSLNYQESKQENNQKENEKPNEVDQREAKT